MIAVALSASAARAVVASADTALVLTSSAAKARVSSALIAVSNFMSALASEVAVSWKLEVVGATYAPVADKPAPVCVTSNSCWIDKSAAAKSERT